MTLSSSIARRRSSSGSPRSTSKTFVNMDTHGWHPYPIANRLISPQVSCLAFTRANSYTEEMKTLPFLLSSFLLAGCGTPQVWYQEGKSASDAYRDLADCKMRGAYIGSPGGAYHSWNIFENRAEHENWVKDCMRGKGWMPLPPSTITNGQSYPALP